MMNVRTMIWRDNVDTEMFAACCMCEEVYRGVIYRAATFLLISTRGREWVRWRDMVEQKMKDELARAPADRRRRYGMPIVGLVRDNNRA